MDSRSESEDAALSTPHDVLFRHVFQAPSQARGLLERLLPEDLAQAIDWETLCLEPAELPDRLLSPARADLLFSVRLRERGGRTALIQVLLEHQSRPQRHLPVRLLGYMVRIWERCVRELGSGRPLPVVIPVVILHGPRRWRGPNDLRHLLDLGEPAEPSLLPYVADFRFVLEDLGARSVGELASWPLSPLGRATLCCLRAVAEEPDLARALRRIAAPLRELAAGPLGPEQVGAVTRYILAVRDEHPDVVLVAVRVEIGPEVEETMKKSAYEQLIERGVEKGRREGRQEGRQEGWREGWREGRVGVLERLLEKRFGPLPTDVLARIEGASVEELDLWAERVLDAASLAEVFAESS